MCEIGKESAGQSVKCWVGQLCPKSGSKDSHEIECSLATTSAPTGHHDVTSYPSKRKLSHTYSFFVEIEVIFPMTTVKHVTWWCGAQSPRSLARLHILRQHENVHVSRVASEKVGTHVSDWAQDTASRMHMFMVS